MTFVTDGSEAKDSIFVPLWKKKSETNSCMSWTHNLPNHILNVYRAKSLWSLRSCQTKLPTLCQQIITKGRSNQSQGSLNKEHLLPGAIPNVWG